MPKWNYKNIKEMKRLDRWLAYFTNRVTSEEMEAIVIREPAIQKAIEIESIFTKDQILRREYEQREKAIMDYNSAMSAATRIGYSKGHEEGRMKMGLGLLQDNVPVEIVAKHSGISVEQLKMLMKVKS